MTDADDSPQRDGLGGLFDNLPTASSHVPERTAREEPAPGSRRALREARGISGSDPTISNRTEPDAAPAAPQAASESVAVAEAASSRVSAATSQPAANQPAANQLDDLFAPERHRDVPKKKRGRGCLIGLIIVIVLLGGIAAGGAWVYNTYQDKIDEMMGWGEPKDYDAGQATGEALVTIKKGDTGSPVSTTLFKAGVTKTDRVFYDYLIKENPTVTFYPGVYKLQKKMTAAAAMKALDDPKTRMESTVRIAEGSTVASSLPLIADGVKIAPDDLSRAVSDPSKYGVQAKSLEGWLFPAVYTFDPGASAEDVIARMVQRTRESLKKAGVPDDDAQRVLTIASIIEREARTSDFAKVSRVIQNRLDKGMKLQMDSTAQYGYGELHAGKASTSKEAQHNDNAWNTYVITGLPQWPIANPGDSAIKAAMHPADGSWLYFVTIDMSTGETQFSNSYEEHQQGIKKMLAWCKANPGTGC